MRCKVVDPSKGFYNTLLSENDLSYSCPNYFVLLATVRLEINYGREIITSEVRRKRKDGTPNFGANRRQSIASVLWHHVLWRGRR